MIDLAMILVVQLLAMLVHAPLSFWAVMAVSLLALPVGLFVTHGL